LGSYSLAFVIAGSIAVAAGLFALTINRAPRPANAPAGASA